jgi:hypothetical protein
MFLQGNQGATGKQTGNGVIISAGEFGEQLASELMARNCEATYRGQRFSALFPSAALAVAGASSQLTDEDNPSLDVKEMNDELDRVAALCYRLR